MSAILTELDTVEVSLVTRGANRKRFALRKKEGEPVATKKPTKKAEPGEPSEAARAAVAEAMKLLHSVEAELPTGMLEAMHEALGIEVEEAAAPVEPPAPPAPTTPEEPAMATETKKTEALNDEARALITKAETAAQAATAQAAELKKSLEAEGTKRVELEKQIAVERDERQTREWVAKAEKLSHLPTKAAELGPILKTLHQAAPEATAKLEAVLAGTNEKLSKVLELTKELGHAGEPQATTAWGEIQKAAGELRKVDPKLTEAQSVTKALELNPKLYEAYNSERAS